ncbi:MAG: ATP-dependent helicase [Anaerolineae bacterium]|nr:ATP-dependent helicase [Anaerolineae bacterium]
MGFEPRAEQREILAYRGGRMAIAAVPGSGKTRTLSYLAARLVAEADLREEQEVLVVTMSNSAADNFSQQIEGFLRETFDLPTGFGYRVRTLHALAHDIVRMRPELLGLSERFEIIDEAESERLLTDVVQGWVKASPGWYYELDENPDTARSRSHDWLDLLMRSANAFIKKAKDERWSVGGVSAGLKATQEPLILARACLDIYERYQGLLDYRGAVDFADLIAGALVVLGRDAALLALLQDRWAYVLEDEAQDSTLAQEALLRVLTERHGNWVRVGDPNQAIYETFTTASPEHLRRFMGEAGVVVRALPRSGRSAGGIIAAANTLSRWAREHPNDAVRAVVPLAPPEILPTLPDDPQPNPPDQGRALTIAVGLQTSDEERKRVAEHIRKSIDAGHQMTMAVLVPRNKSGAEMAKALEAVGVPFSELLRTPSSTRKAAHALYAVVDVLAHPVDMGRLERAYAAWLTMRTGTDELDVPGASELVFRLLKRNVVGVEDVLFGDEAPIAEVLERLSGEDMALAQGFWVFREMMQRWLRAAVLPIDQIVLIIGQELFSQPVDLAITHALGLTMRRAAEREPTWQLAQFAGELKQIAENRGVIYGFGDADEGEGAAPEATVTISTMHRSKGLEWDRVYLTSVNSYDFPSGEPQDTYLGERDFVKGKLDVVQEAVAQLEAVMMPEQVAYEAGAATQRARTYYIAERLRLLYVGMTRARRELFMTANQGQGQARPAKPLLMLDAWLRGTYDDAAQ